MKKLLLGLGAMTSVIAPIAAVVSCGKDDFIVSYGVFQPNLDDTTVKVPLVFTHPKAAPEKLTAEQAGFVYQEYLGVIEDAKEYPVKDTTKVNKIFVHVGNVGTFYTITATFAIGANKDVIIAALMAAIPTALQGHKKTNT